MIDKLIDLIPDVIDSIRSEDHWDSLIINKRKPHTIRAFRMFGENRVCIHKFEPCEASECFHHPHSWPVAVLMLKGKYLHDVGYTSLGHEDILTAPEPIKWMIKEIIRPGTIYEITNPYTWHKVQPLEETLTIMINGPDFKEKHSAVRTTKGKNFDSLSEDDLNLYLHYCAVLLKKWQ